MQDLKLILAGVYVLAYCLQRKLVRLLCFQDTFGTPWLVGLQDITCRVNEAFCCCQTAVQA